jgi:DNA repair protein RadC
MALYELRVVRRDENPQIGKPTETEAIRITNIKHIFPFVREIRNHDQEHVLIITLDREHLVIAARIVHIGGATECCVNLRDVYRGAIVDNAEYIIFIHNHPGNGNTLRPSKADKKMMKKLCKIGTRLDIGVIDFIIVSGDGLYSCGEKRKIRVKS